MARISFGSNATVRGTVPPENDTLVGTAFPTNNNDLIYAGPGNDLIYAVYGLDNSTVYGGAGNDTMFDFQLGLGFTFTNNDVIYGGEGNDVIFTYGINNIVFGEAGNDSIVLQTDTFGGNSVAYGGEGDDFLSARNRAVGDVLYGNLGNDTISSFETTNTVAYGGMGDDSIRQRESAFAALYGNKGDDIVIDEEGPGFVPGNIGLAQGNSILYGGQGDDTLVARAAGGDTMYGGLGNDLLAANDAVPFINASNLITVGDFVSGQDRLALSTSLAGSPQDITKVDAPGVSNASQALSLANSDYQASPAPGYQFLYGGTGAGYLFYNGDGGGMVAAGGMILVGDNAEASLSANDIVASPFAAGL